MECNSSDVRMSHCAEGSETTIEIKIKTLDSQTYNLRVNKCVPIPLLKDKIATVTGILSEQQRLICRGRVLKDDELLSAYHVEDGHTLHLVVRQPGQPAASGSAGNEANVSNSTRRHGRTVRSIVLEAVDLEQGSEFSSLAQILQSLLTSPQVQGGSAPSDTRPSEPMQSSFPNDVRVELDQQQASLHFPEAAVGSSLPNVIPDSVTTISQYINFMRDSFRREGFNGNAQTVRDIDPGTAGSVHVGGTQSQESQPGSTSAHHVLPTAALLAETMQSTRQLLVDLAGELLSQLSTQLGDLGNVSDSPTRRNLQQSAMRQGVLLQNLGSLLLELGRTTMTLRINPTPSEAVVNSGPAVFISPSGPNPLMVPPVPFFPGPRSVQMGQMFSSLGSQGSVLHPRDADIHVRTSGSVPVASTNPSESAGAQQAQEHTDRTGNASHSNAREAFARVAGGAPFAVGSGVRLLPLRTVGAVPAGISRSPSGSSSGGVGVIFPMITRVHQRVNSNGSGARNGQTPNEPHSDTHANLQPNPQPPREAGNLGHSIDVNAGNSSQASHGQQNGQGPLSQLMDSLQWIGSLFSGETPPANGTSHHAPAASAEPVDARNHAVPEVSVASDEGIRFANLVRQIMPHISNVENQPQSTPADTSSTPSQAAVPESANGSRDGPSDSRNSRQHSRDPVDGPNSKRQRMSE
ncbi:hypothetical protein D1007_41105 [Hordeum vulgare]|uniref:Ubiquitin-like domain-containing protein n=3 Tax=Hordeum vulgare subsp. vulgare TaxID=112509 RepID=A0A8I6XJZ9_HORVV|nr:ubiquitin-like domain-containing protein CIP73 isoform X1 [Hordeum vulgare subsp. vulgare]XP_044974781.1 ubiquitin-like domain-containing protein CIP73 isoform X1 [Hordeum vulgare subsp. vulgare]KAE8785186.1 hypothetical protein D1007_41105 [Hordeum vulgare]